MPELEATQERTSSTMMPARHVIQMTVGLLLLTPCGSTARGEQPEEYSPERSRLIVIEDGSPSNTDPYDDLGDFVATYEVRLMDDLNTPSQHMQVGRVQVSRRGEWVCVTDSLQQPVAGADGRTEAPWLQSAWIFNDSRCEGFFLNSQMTVDPNGLFSPEGHLLRPLRLGLGWAIEFDSNSQRWQLLDHGAAESHFAQGKSSPVAIASRGGLPTEKVEGATPKPVTDWADCTKFTVRSFAGTDRRATAGTESGMKYLLDDGTAFEVTLNSISVPRWTGKLPAEIISVGYHPVDISGASRAEGVARLAEANSPASLEARKRTECVMTLLNVRTATPQDRIAMSDWESVTDSIAFNDPSSAAQSVRTRSEQDDVTIHWSVNPISQRWEQMQ